MHKSLKAGMLVAIATAIFAVAPPLAAQGVSQIAINCTTPAPEAHTTNGCISSEGAQGGTPFIIVGSKLYAIGGFWVWCQSPSGGTPYGPDCNGAIYIGEVNLVTGGAVYETTSVSGTSSASGTTGLQVTFKSSDGDMSCTLSVPASPSSGGTNTLSGSCDSVPITFSNAVVLVTK